MADLKKNEKQCVNCTKERACCRCLGCEDQFCLACMHSHRNEIEAQFDNLIHEQDRLFDSYTDPESMQKHPLLTKINKWEQTSISRIKQVAAENRGRLQKTLDEVKIQFNTPLKELSRQLCVIKETKNFVEQDITYWNKKLNQLRENINKSLGMNVVIDKIHPPIYLIQLKTTQEDISTQSSMISSKSNASSDNSNSPDKPLETHQSDPLESDKRVTEQEESSDDDLLNQIKTTNVILLELSTSNGSELSTGLHKLTEGNYCSIERNTNWLSELQQSEKQSALIVDMSDLSLKEQDEQLADICEQTDIRSIYIRGIPPDTDEERERFFSKYPIITAMFKNEKSVLAQWALDTASEYKRIGDRYIAKGDKDLAQQYFAKGVSLYKRLSTYLHKTKTSEKKIN